MTREQALQKATELREQHRKHDNRRAIAGLDLYELADLIERACGQDAMDANEAASRAINRLGIKCGSNSAGLSNEKTGGCGQVISGIEHIFRCADCQTPFCSQRCIKQHFPEERACGQDGLLEWAVGRWKAEVENRPLVNVHRRTLDDTWRQVIRYAGGDPIELVGTDHDTRLALNPVKPAERSCGETAWVSAREFYKSRYGDNPDMLSFSACMEFAATYRALPSPPTGRTEEK